MMKKNKELILIDGNALLYRAFYALPSFTNIDGVPTGAVFGFIRMLMKLLRKEEPQYIACAFDKGRKTFRHQKSKDYKANRPAMPEELVAQIPLIKETLGAFRIPVFEEEEYEADDLLGTLAKKGEKEGLQVKIFSGDKDFLQLVSSSIFVLRPKKGISGTYLFNEEEVKKEFDISPSQIVDFLALAGDSSDNISGVPGIGPVTAKALIQEFDSLENLLENLEKLSLKKRELIKRYISQAKLSKELATIITSVPIKINIEELRVKKPDKDILFPLFTKLNFKGLMKEFALQKPQKANRKDYSEITTCQNLEDLVSKLKEASFVLAVEKSENLQGIAFLLEGGASYWLPLERTKIKKDLLIGKLSPILEDSKIKKTTHNFKETIFKIKEWGMNLDGLNFDTELAAYLLDPLSSNYSLRDLSFDYLGIEPGQEFHPVKRAKLTGELALLLKKRLKEENLWDLFLKVEMPLVEVLVKMQERGIKVNRATLEEFLQDIKKRGERLKEKIYQETGEKFNINSSKQLGKILFERLNLPPIKKTKTGYSTDEEVLRTLCLLRPSLSKISEYRRLFKLETGYIKPLPELINSKTGRIHTSFNQTVTATGRLSSSQPNLQNIPIRNKLGERLRKAFLADKGYLFISADYSQIELRLLAHLSRDTNLKSAFLRGEDIHRQTAAEIFQVLPLQVTPQMRRKAKIVNFGILYGISPYGLSRDMGISQKEAEEYIQRYFKRYLKVREYIDRILEEARKQRYVTTLMGRKRPLPGILVSNRKRREFAERTAINSPIQGGAADLIKLSMINLHRRLKKENSHAYIILQIHDELLLEAPENQIEMVRKIVKQEMEQVMKLSVPLIVNTKIGKNWGDMK